MKTLGSAAIIIIGTAITLLPVEFWFFVWWMVGPVGFWQKALIAGAGIWICGAVQIIFLAVGITLTGIFLSEYRDGQRKPWERR